MGHFSPGWYVIYTMPCHEKKVHFRLTELSIVGFLPTKKTLRTWHDRKKYVDEPLFPSYLFVFLKDLRNYYEGNAVEGVLSYVRIGKDLARVNESVINDIKLVTEKGSDIEVTKEQFLPGRKLVIGKGPLTGLSCEVVEVNKRELLLVRVNLLQRNVLLTLPRESLMTV